jgi:hypothetical protein
MQRILAQVRNGFLERLHLHITGPVSATIQLDDSKVQWRRHFDHLQSRGSVILKSKPDIESQEEETPTSPVENGNPQTD